MKRHRFQFFVPVLAIAIILGFGFSLGRLSQEKRVKTPAPIVLQKVRHLGELHLVEHEYQTVLTIESHKEPAEWTQSVPILNKLATHVVEKATRNSALVTVSGSVESGINLSDADVVASGDTLIVTVSKPKIYPPNVDAELHRQTSSIAWDDKNLALKARREGASRFMNASLKGGILEDTKVQAQKQLSSLLSGTGFETIEVRFK